MTTPNTDKDNTIKEYFSDLAKQSHKKNPRPKEFYQNMVNKRWAKARGAEKEAEQHRSDSQPDGDNSIE